MVPSCFPREPYLEGQGDLGSNRDSWGWDFALLKYGGCIQRDN